MSWWLGKSRDQLREAATRTNEFQSSKFGRPEVRVNVITTETETTMRAQRKVARTPVDKAPALPNRLDALRAAGHRAKAARSLFACKPVAPVVSCSTSETFTSPLPSNGEQQKEEKQMVQFTRKQVLKRGASYGLPGLKGLLIIRTPLAEGASFPETLSVDFDGFAPPDTEAFEKAKARATKKAERDAKSADRVKLMQDRAAKAQERAAKAVERATKAAAKLAGPAATGEAPAAE